MMMKYTTEKAVKKFKLMSLLAIGLIIFGIVLMLMGDYSASGKYSIIGELIDKLIMITLGIYLYIFNTKKIKLIKENSFEIDNESLTIHTKDKNITFNSENKPKSIDIKLKTIIIKSSNNIDFVINIDDFTKEFKLIKTIKDQMETLKTNFYT